MSKHPIIVIGAGPAGLCAAIEARKAGAEVMVFDNNLKPGGQLFKQIHKFFGSNEHRAGIRGFEIGKDLLEEAEKLNIQVYLNTEVCGISKDKRIWGIQNGEKTIDVQGSKIILATGAMEKPIPFHGWTLPGVMGAGAAQTMINVHRVLPGKRVLMLGSGNVGVIVAYQLLQAGAEVVAVLEAAPRLGAYGVHTAKVRRARVPFYTSTTITSAWGEKHVEAAEIVRLDEHWEPVKGTEETLQVDTICIATGLTPLVELTYLAGCESTFIGALGGYVPIHNQYMETTMKDIYVAGDITGVEEANTAMEEGRLAGVCAASALGLYTEEEKRRLVQEIWGRLDALRHGPFGEKRKQAKERMLNHGGRALL